MNLNISNRRINWPPYDPMVQRYIDIGKLLNDKSMRDNIPSVQNYVQLRVYKLVGFTHPINRSSDQHTTLRFAVENLFLE